MKDLSSVDIHAPHSRICNDRSYSVTFPELQGKLFRSIIHKLTLCTPEHCFKSDSCGIFHHCVLTALEHFSHFKCYQPADGTLLTVIRALDMAVGTAVKN